MCDGSSFLTNSKSITNVIWSPGISEVTFPFLYRGENQWHRAVIYLRSRCLGETYHLHDFLTSNCSFYLGDHGAPSILNGNQNRPNLESS